MNANEILKTKLQMELNEISNKPSFNVKDLELAHILTDTIQNILGKDREIKHLKILKVEKVKSKV
ncbi:MAG: hypothetical protein NC320_00760 [Clostridium sp.]|nr:hypothetical protein [Clostridium sp.]MCM1546921.1 hypothetical protein [Ruminococcus sp.]